MDIAWRLAGLAAVALGVLTWAGLAPRPTARAGVDADETPAIAAVLDAFHAAAAVADGERYFACLAPRAVFLGTDATERWSRDEFRKFVEPYFVKGIGWKYVPRDRQIELAPGGQVAWFDELLENAKYGTCRGSGVLVRVGQGPWQIAQYNLSIPIPNALAGEVVKLIRQAEPGPGAKP
ncbi:MAG TPA: nuclear transport factor 2 family protein [Gemmatales bacterium]|nr:nuclear transport factor 2 family protein [Gemmatales bacterium]